MDGSTLFVKQATAGGGCGGGKIPHGDLWEDGLHYSTSTICEAISAVGKIAKGAH